MAIFHFNFQSIIKKFDRFLPISNTFRDDFDFKYFITIDWGVSFNLTGIFAYLIDRFTFMSILMFITISLKMIFVRKFSNAKGYSYSI